MTSPRLKCNKNLDHRDGGVVGNRYDTLPVPENELKNIIAASCELANADTSCFDLQNDVKPIGDLIHLTHRDIIFAPRAINGTVVGRRQEDVVVV